VTWHHASPTRQKKKSSDERHLSMHPTGQFIAYRSPPFALAHASLAKFVSTVSAKGGVEHFVVHARKAVLGGLSPDANRKVLPALAQAFASN